MANKDMMSRHPAHGKRTRARMVMGAVGVINRYVSQSLRLGVPVRDHKDTMQKMRFKGSAGLWTNWRRPQQKKKMKNVTIEMTSAHKDLRVKRGDVCGRTFKEGHAKR